MLHSRLRTQILAANPGDSWQKAKLLLHQRETAQRKHRCEIGNEGSPNLSKKKENKNMMFAKQASCS